MFGRGLGGAAGGTTAAIGGRVSDDWENRQFNETMQYNLLAIAEFLNRFGKESRVSSGLTPPRLDSTTETRFVVVQDLCA